MSSLAQDVRHALRAFATSPGFTAAAVIVLALGVGANTAVFTLANALLLKPRAGHADALVGLYASDRKVPDSYRAFSYPEFADLRARSGVFGGGLMAHTFAMVAVPAGDASRRAFASVVSSNYFDTLGVRLAAGRPFTPGEERPDARIPVVIVNYARWKAAGLDPHFPGRTIRVNAQDFTVVGVTPEGFTGTTTMVSAEMWFPLGMFDVVVNDRLKNRSTGLQDRGHYGLIVAGRLTPRLSDAVVQARLDAVARELADANPAANQDLALTYRLLPRFTTSTRPVGDGPVGAVMALFLALSAGVLAIACFNVANMLLARGVARRKEMAVRLALGAGRGRVVRQMLTEGLLLAGAGSAAALLVSYAATRTLASSLTAVLPLALEFDPAPDGRVLLATIGFAVASTLVFGLVPALKLSRRDLVTDLKDLGGDAARVRRFGARNLLVVAQVALSLALVTAGGLFARASMAASRSDPGYRYDRLLLASIDPSLAGAGEQRAAEIQREALDRVRRLPGVEAAGLSSTMPFGDFHEGERVRRLGHERAEPVSATYRIIGSDYFRSLGLTMVRGREFTDAEERSAGAPRVALVDAALARQVFGGDDPIGQSIVIVPRAGEVAQEPFLVVGVAPPVLEEITDPAPAPHLYVAAGRHPRGEMHLTVRAAQAGSETALLQAVRQELRAASPQLAVLALTTMRAFHDSSLALWALRAGGSMFTALGGLALLLAVAGVYGVRAYVVAQRTREFGIRMALGADRRRVLWLVLREGLAVAAAGVLAGLPLALLAATAMARVMHRIGGIDPLVFTVAPLVLLTAALAASYLPARRATGTTPFAALRTD